MGARRRRRNPDTTPVCQYCQKNAELVKGSFLFGEKANASSVNRGFWFCQGCDAYIACEHNSNVPIGTLANEELRVLRKRAHKAFDPIWSDVDSMMTRNEAYRWLADRMKLSLSKTHISLFGVEQCREVIRLCTAR